MNKKNLGIQFSETMEGGLMMGESDCRTGEKGGSSAGDIFAMHAVVVIDDMERFIAEASHAGSLSGTIDYPPFGNAIPCHNGKFNLFSPTDDPQMKYMVYELGFEHEGKAYYVAGHKEVKDDPGFDLWSDTTTLYTKLYEGDDDSGPVIGAGVLSLGVTELMKLVASMKVTNADDVTDKVQTLASFGHFFMGELWDTYVEKVQQSEDSSGAGNFDVIVIGSGFGGAVSAGRLAEKGQKVLVLERGRRWQPEDYPREPGDAWIWDEAQPKLFNGWTDVQFFDDMAVARGAGVGGGSLIYASVSIVPPKERFEHGWPSEITHEELLPYYEKVGQMLNVQPIPQNQLTRRYALMKDAAEANGFSEQFKPVELAVSFDPEWHYGLDDCFNDNKSKSWVNEQGQQQGTCVHCANCDLGCQVKAKNTLDLNYIPLAEKHGAEVRPLHIVRNITPLEEGGYRVDFDRIEGGCFVAGSETAKRVIVAAGSLGSTELLLRCREQHRSLPNISSRLGYGWSANGDFITPSVHTRDVDSTEGPTISSAIDLLEGQYKGAKLFIEDGGFPDLIGNMLEQHLKSRWWPFKSRFGMLFNALARRVRAREPLDSVMLWFGQAVDAADGRFYLGRPWYAPWKRVLKLDWDITRSEKTIQAMADLHEKLAQATDGTPFIPPTWTLLKNLITPHPLGGCGMGDSARSGVVNHKGEVFGHPGLYVVDGAILPQALGLNPSRTIAALAERIVDKMGL